MSLLLDNKKIELNNPKRKINIFLYISNGKQTHVL